MDGVFGCLDGGALDRGVLVTWQRVGDGLVVGLLDIGGLVACIVGIGGVVVGLVGIGGFGA